MTELNPKNLRILVIDDMPAIHDDFRKILIGSRQSGSELDLADAGLFGPGEPRGSATAFAVDSAYQGQEGLACVRRALAEGRPYAMVFVDVRMPPGWDGIETVEQIWSVYPDMQVVLCTAYSDYSWDDMIAKLGHSDRLLILKKPFDNVEVLQLATALTEKWRLQQEVRGKMDDLEQRVKLRTRELEAAMAQLQVSLRDHERSEAEVRKSEELFRALSASSPIGIWLADTAGRCLYCNTRWERMAGRPAGATAGDGWRQVLHPDDRAGVVAAWKSVMAAGGALEREFRLQRPDGELRWVLAQSAPLKAGGRDLTGHVVTFEDITERKRAEETLRFAKEAAEEAARAKSEFLANMSHEIRTPMNGVIGMTDLLLDTKLDAEQRACAETVRDSADTLLTIVNDILDFSKIEARKLAFEQHDFNLRQVVEGTLDMLAPRAQARGLELCTVEIAPDVPPWLRGDSGRLRQILTNLIGNAVKFTPRGHVAVRVTRAGGTPPDAVVCFEVEDTGPGISPEAQAKLFQAFTQADSSTTREFGGTGLGLAISRQLVQMMGGAIGVESEPGRGATFRFTVRFETVSSPGAEGEFEPVAEARRALVVSDNARHGEIVRRQLDRWKVATDLVEGAAALTRLRGAAADGELYDLVLLDLPVHGAPGGSTLATAIKADATLRDTRIFGLAPIRRVLTGGAAREAGLDGCIAKPVRLARLREALALAWETAGSDDGRGLQRAGFTRASRAPGYAATRILLVEDNAVNRRVALGQLRMIGCSARAVTNGREALEAMADAAYDVVFMDCQMPEMDGYDATRAIRAWENDPSRPRPWKAPIHIVAITAHALDGEREKCLAAGMNDYLSKPVLVSGLRAALETWRSLSAARDTHPLRGTAA